MEEGRPPKNGKDSEASDDDDKKSDASGAEGEKIPKYEALVPEQWLARLQEFQAYHMIKFPRMWQCVFYFVKFQSRAEICEFDTNKLTWSKAKAFLTSQPGEPNLYTQLGAYTPFGPKESEYKEYQKLAFIRETLDELDEPEITNFSVALGKLYSWMQKTIELRIEDVTSRRNNKDKEREYYHEAVLKDKERSNKRDDLLLESKAIWEEAKDAELAAQQEANEAAGDGENKGTEEDDKKSILDFDMPEFDAKFEDENPVIDIPSEVLEDIDNDFNLIIEKEEEEDNED